MKKKIYFQNQIVWHWFAALYFIVACLSIGFVIYSIITLVMNPQNDLKFILLVVFSIIICLLTSIYTARRFLSLEGFNIHLNDERVWMKKEINWKELRTQYEASIYLKDIKDIKTIVDKRKSNGGKICYNFHGDGHRAVPLWDICVYRKYLVFEDYKGKETRMNVSHYTEDYLLSIVYDIIERIEASDNQDFDRGNVTFIKDLLSTKK